MRLNTSTEPGGEESGGLWVSIASTATSGEIATAEHGASTCTVVDRSGATAFAAPESADMQYTGQPSGLGVECLGQHGPWHPCGMLEHGATGAAVK